MHWKAKMTQILPMGRRYLLQPQRSSSRKAMSPKAQ
jgi:hypothetical protein